MAISLQRLGDNPRDFDGHFKGLPRSLSGVSTVVPDADLTNVEAVMEHQDFEPWKIYPPPPPPHWHWRDENIVVAADGTEQVKKAIAGEFQREHVNIPAAHPWEFKVDDKGVYQVFDPSTKGAFLIDQSLISITVFTRNR